jgi:hypothetical protein
MNPIPGQRVRRTAQHPRIPVGMLGTIDIVHENGSDFWVLTEEGGFNGWVDFGSWESATTEESP